MVTLLITAFIIFIIIGMAFYFRQKSAPQKPENLLPPGSARGLFADPGPPDDRSQRETDAAKQAESVIAKARDGQREALNAAHDLDQNVYDEVLNELVRQADSDPKLLALISHVVQRELPVNVNLARAIVTSWKRSPDRGGTSKTLHIAALTDDPEFYRGTVETVLELWRERKLKDVSPVELRALFDGEFWVLSSGSRRSGAGFLLKRTLARARRELEAAERANP